MGDHTLALVLEYIAFGGSLCSAWLYGRQGIRGPIAGLATAAAFLAFGLNAEIYAAVLSNLVFAVVHLNNLKRALDNDMDRTKTKLAAGINYMADRAHQASKDAGWWNDPATGEALDVDAQVPLKLLLIHSEVSEAMEGHRKSLMDDKLPHIPMTGAELGDIVIRVGDLAKAMGYNLGDIVADKMEFNEIRPDHKPENRSKTHGKKY